LRLDAFEHYIRGLLANEDDARLRELREAARLEPDWPDPAFALGQVYYGRRDCASALQWLGHVPKTSLRYAEAVFTTGVCRMWMDEPDKAEVVFVSLQEALKDNLVSGADLPEILNNVGLARARQGKTAEGAAALLRCGAQFVDRLPRPDMPERPPPGRAAELDAGEVGARDDRVGEEPQALREAEHAVIVIRGRLPDLSRLPDGCVFAPRCDFVEDACTRGQPAMATVGPAHVARCLRWDTVIATPPTPRAGPGAPPLPEIAAPVARVESLTKHYEEPGVLARWLGLARPPVHAIDDVTFDVRGGEVLALVGESGCGKTTLGRLLLRLLPPTSGALSIRRRQSGTEITDDAEFRRVVRIVFQNPDSSLNPTKRVAAILERPLAIQGVPRMARRLRVRELLEAVRLDAGYLHRLPRALSGGEKQRVAIARAFATGPELVVLDEPLSALDVSSQASVVDLLTELRSRLDATYVFISHDLSLVRHLADRIGVMYLGRLVELGTVDEIFRPPYHPYTRALLSSIPVPDPSAPRSTVRLEGAVPSARRPPSGCRFHTRCASKIGRICEEVEPLLQRVDGTHWLACHIPVEDLRRERPIRPAPRST